MNNEIHQFMLVHLLSMRVGDKERDIITLPKLLRSIIDVLYQPIKSWVYYILPRRVFCEGSQSFQLSSLGIVRICDIRYVRDHLLA